MSKRTNRTSNARSPVEQLRSDGEVDVLGEAVREEEDGYRVGGEIVHVAALLYQVAEGAPEIARREVC